jgi:hypothetical protein
MILRAETCWSYKKQITVNKCFVHLMAEHNKNSTKCTVHNLSRKSSWVFSNPEETISIQNLPGIIKDTFDPSVTYKITEQAA